MFRKRFATMVFHLKHRSRSMFLTSCMMLFAMAVLLTNPTSALADGVPGGNIANPVVRAVDIAKPAVVRIITNISGNVTVDFSSTRSATFPQNGGNYKIEFSGSGAFITAHGDILTANHVVNPPHDTELDNALYDAASQDVANYINLNYTVSSPYTAIDAFALMTNGNFHTATHYGQPGSDVYLSTDYTGPLPQTKLEKLGANVRFHVTKIEQQSATDVHDIAIIHINLDDTPSIHLGDSSNVAQQDELTIIGFPGNADINDQNSDSLLTSSVNKIYVSALKKNAAGSSLIQVGGNVEHGDSGGPALDSNGNIVGIVSFYSGKGDYPIATSFLQASNNVQSYLEYPKLDTAPGTFEKAWQQAFVDYTSTAPGHWHKALQKFQNLGKNYPNFNALDPYLNYAVTQAGSEKLPTPKKPASTNWTPLIIGIIVFLLIVLIGVLFIALRRKKSVSTIAATSNTQPNSTTAAHETSTPPVHPFPEWEAQQASLSELLQTELQQNAAPSQNWPWPTTPTPTPWQQEPYSLPVSPTPPIFEKWQQPTTTVPSSPIAPTADIRSEPNLTPEE